MRPLRGLQETRVATRDESGVLGFPSRRRLLLLYSTVDKISRLKMKSFSTVRDTQRGSQSYMEKRRGRRELEVTRMRGGGINRGESKLASNHFLMCTPQLDRSEMFTELHREDKREEGDKRWPGG